MTAGSDTAGRMITGLVAIAAGAVIVALALEGNAHPWLRHFVLAVLMIAFGTPFNWVAFGPGAREFTGSAGVGPVAVAGHANEVVGRVAFGIGAVLMDVIAVVVWASLFRALARRPGTGPT